MTLNRDSYYDGEHLVLSDQVAMPDVFDYTVRAGYWKHGLYVPVSFTQQITLGGHDIRRQDMPFVSNRMNVSRVDVVAMYFLRHPRFVFRVGAAAVVSGRNSASPRPSRPASSTRSRSREKLHATDALRRRRRRRVSRPPPAARTSRPGPTCRRPPPALPTPTPARGR